MSHEACKLQSTTRTRKYFLSWIGGDSTSRCRELCDNITSSSIPRIYIQCRCEVLDFLPPLISVEQSGAKTRYGEYGVVDGALGSFKV